MSEMLKELTDRLNRAGRGIYSCDGDTLMTPLGPLTLREGEEEKIAMLLADLQYVIPTGDHYTFDPTKPVTVRWPGPIPVTETDSGPSSTIIGHCIIAFFGVLESTYVDDWRKIKLRPDDTMYRSQWGMGDHPILQWFQEPGNGQWVASVCLTGGGGIPLHHVFIGFPYNARILIPRERIGRE